MIASLQACGTLPKVQLLLKICNSFALASVPRFLIISLETPSAPGDFLIFVLIWLASVH